MSIVENCGLRRYDDLPFIFTGGACGNFEIDGRNTVLLCFDKYQKSMCRRLVKIYQIQTII